MPAYIYKARDVTGKLVKGVMDAVNKDEIIDKLRKMGYMTTKVTESLPTIKIESALEKLKTVSIEDIIIFNIQFSNLISAGISVLNSLDTLAKQVESKKLRETIDSVRRNVEAGDSLSGAFARHPRIFSALFVNMIRAGEASGKLAMVLQRYAEFAEHREELRQKIKGALFYPIILLLAGTIVTLFIITFVIPQFAEIFIKVGIKLPMPTLILLNTGVAIKRFWHLFILFAILSGSGISYYLRTKSGRFKFDRLKLKLPIIGSLYRKVSISRFTRTLGTLISSGVPILQSLDIVKDVIGNEILAQVIGSARIAVEKGERIAESLRISEEIPPDAVQMISVGEETGNLDGMLNKISDFYDISVGHTVKKLTTIIEPLFLVIMGVMVGFIMASILLPIFDMVKVLRH